MKPPAWSQEEESILREIYAVGNVRRHIHRLPGRTVAAARRRAIRIGIDNNRSPAWTPEEDEIIRRGYEAGTPLKEILRSLPIRTYRGIRSRASVIGSAGKFNGLIGCTYSWVIDAVKKELSAGSKLTAISLAAKVGASEASLWRVLRKMKGEVYIADWQKNTRGYSAIWALGNLPDVPKPKPASAAEKCRLYRKNRKVKLGRVNPFAVAAGLVQAPESKQGRVFKQDMEIDQWFQSRAA